MNKAKHNRFYFFMTLMQKNNIVQLEPAILYWEGAMDQREIRGAMDQGPIEGATDQETIEGTMKVTSNR